MSTEPLHACTIIARNRLAHARVLAESFFRHHPDGAFTVLVIDDVEESIDPAGERFRLLRGPEIFSERREFHRMAAIYTVIELATAVKPTLLRFLLDEGAPEVVYFDPDVWIHAPLDDLVQLVRERSIVLTPHYTEPPRGWRQLEWEHTTAVCGAYNCGFVAVSARAGEFLAWWAERCARHCLEDRSAGYFVDQLWLDLVPCYFDHVVVRDPGWNVAPWNLVVNRKLEWAHGGYRADGAPLRFFHFSGGFEPENPHLLSGRLRPTPPTLLSEHPALARICREYAEALYGHGYEEWHDMPYAFETLPGGLPVDAVMRRAYRRGLLAAERFGGAEPPSPFEPGETEAFLAWLREPPDAASAATRITRYLRVAWESSAELRARFPDLSAADAEAFLAWARSEGPDALGAPASLLEPAAEPRLPAAHALDWPERLDPGVVLVRRADDRGDLGRVARRLESALAGAATPFAVLELPGAGVEVGDPFLERGAEALRYDTVVLCLSPSEIAGFAFYVPGRFFAERHTVALWLDAGSEPALLAASLPFVDELWVAAEASARDLAARAGKPVLTVPLPAEPPRDQPPGRPSSRREESFAVLSIVDLARLGVTGAALALVAAYAEAFPAPSGTTLLLRAVADDMQLADLERLRLASARQDVRVVGGLLGEEERASLLSACDCYASLEEDCESSLALLDAVTLGKPVVARALPGVGEGDGLWVAGGAPERAAELLQLVRDRPDAAAERAARARARVMERHGSGTVAAFVRERLAEARRGRETGGPPATALERAVAYLERGPSNPWRAPSQLGRLGVLARRVVLRLLRPYTAPRHELDAAAVEALRVLEERRRTLAARLAELETRAGG